MGVETSMRPAVILVALHLIAVTAYAQVQCPANGVLLTPDFTVTPAPVFAGVPLTMNVRDSGIPGFRLLLDGFSSISVHGTDILVSERYIDCCGVGECHLLSRPIGSLAPGRYTVRVRYQGGFNEPFSGEGTVLGTFDVVSADQIPALSDWLLVLLPAALGVIGVVITNRSS